VLVVFVQGADPQLPLHGVHRVEGLAGHPGGRLGERKREGEEPDLDPGPSRQREVQPGGTRLPLHLDVGRLVVAEEDAGSEVSERERREREEEWRAGVRELCAQSEEQPLLLLSPSFVVFAVEG